MAAGALADEEEEEREGEEAEAPQQQWRQQQQQQQQQQQGTAPPGYGHLQVQGGMQAMPLVPWLSGPPQAQYALGPGFGQVQVP